MKEKCKLFVEIGVVSIYMSVNSSLLIISTWHLQITNWQLWITQLQHVLKRTSLIRYAS